MTDERSPKAAKIDARTSLAELAWVFLKLGTTAFGGPAAHIAMMDEEVVVRRGWLTREQFLDFLAAANLIPGPNSTELAIHIGLARAGWAGLVVAGASFIIPAALIVGVLGWIYVRVGALPEASAILYGVKPVVIAIVLQALWRLATSALKSTTLTTIALAAVVATVLRVNELAVLAAAGLAALLASHWMHRRRQHRSMHAFFAPLVSVTGLAQTALATAAPGVSLLGIFGVFLKIGAVLFGSGYVLLAFLRADFVERLGWLTQQQLLDAVVVGQITPGPVFTTATFIGYILAGPSGALVATIGIFLPAFAFVALSGPLIPRLRSSPQAGAFLDGVVAGSLALMVVVTWSLGTAAIVDVATGLIAALGCVIVFRTRINSVWLLIAGALIGLIVRRYL
jgi:chromate transporter